MYEKFKFTATLILSYLHDFSQVMRLRSVSRTFALFIAHFNRLKLYTGLRRFTITLGCSKVANKMTEGVLSWGNSFHILISQGYVAQFEEILEEITSYDKIKYVGRLETHERWRNIKTYECVPDSEEEIKMMNANSIKKQSYHTLEFFNALKLG